MPELTSLPFACNGITPPRGQTGPEGLADYEWPEASGSAGSRGAGEVTLVTANDCRGQIRYVLHSLLLSSIWQFSAGEGMLPEEFKRNPVSDCCIGHLPDLPNHHKNMKFCSLYFVLSGGRL